MGIAATLFKPFRLIGSGASAVVERGIQITPVWKTGIAQFPRPGFRTYNKEGYQKNELVFACIREIATSIADAEPIVFITDGRVEQIVPDHPVKRLLDNPNLHMTTFDFFETLMTLEHVEGNAFVFKQRNEDGIVEELIPLRPDWVAIVPQEDTTRIYEYRPGGGDKTVLIAHEDMIHFPHSVNPEDLYGRGMSPLRVAFRNTALDNDTTDFMKVFFDNAAVPSGIIKINRRLTDRKEAKRIQRQWQERYSGIEGWHAPAVLDENASFEPMGMNFESMELSMIRNVPETRICMAFQVPPILVGANVGLLRSTYSNYVEARASFWDETLAPMYKMHAQRLEKDLLAEFPGAEMTGIKFDMSNVRALEESNTKRWERAGNALKAGGITLNMYLSEIGKQPIGPAGDVFYVPTTNTPVVTPVEAAATNSPARQLLQNGSPVTYRDLVLADSGYDVPQLAPMIEVLEDHSSD